jgi:hypothetical protein
VTTSGFWREIDDRAELLTPDRTLQVPAQQPEPVRPPANVPNAVPTAASHAANPGSDHI